MIEAVLYSETTYEAQITVAISLASIFSVLFSIIQSVMYEKSKTASWRDNVLMVEKKKYKAFGIEVEDEHCMWEFCRGLAILSQHFFGGFMCVPFILGYETVFGYSTAALGRHGAMFEVGFEIYDVFYQVHTAIFKPDKFGGIAVIIFLFLHHFISLSLVTPMNVNFGDNWYYLAMVFNLQGAAIVGFGFAFYAQFLDLKIRENLRFMVYSCWVAAATMAITRGPCWIYLLYFLLIDLYNFSTVWFTVALIACTAMSLFNVFMVWDSYNRACKFHEKYNSPEELDDSDVEEIADLLSRASMNPLVRRFLPDQTTYDVPKFLKKQRSFTVQTPPKMTAVMSDPTAEHNKVKFLEKMKSEEEQQLPDIPDSDDEPAVEG